MAWSAAQVISMECLTRIPVGMRWELKCFTSAGRRDKRHRKIHAIRGRVLGCGVLYKPALPKDMLLHYKMVTQI